VSESEALPAIDAARFAEIFAAVRDQMARRVVGQERAVEHLLVCYFAGGHALLTGMPGLGRTLLVQSLSEILALEYRRIQFTPDLLPSDIIGTEVLQSDQAGGGRSFRFFKGPVFANLVLADEINRCPPRTQSALLEAMQERQVTVAGQTCFLPQPFSLVATQNSLEHQSVWPLGEAQADRFTMAIELSYPPFAEERDIVALATGTEQPAVMQVAGPEEILAMIELAKHVPVVPSVRDFALAMVRASRVGEYDAPAAIAGSIRLGASPRTTQALIRCGKVLALARGRYHVSKRDIAAVAAAVFRHRIMLDFRAKAEGRGFDHVFPLLVQAARAATLPRPVPWTRRLLATDR